MEDADLAAALSRGPGRAELPGVVAKDRGALAAQIVALARDHAVAIRHDQGPAPRLSTLEVDRPIPVAATLGDPCRANRELRDAGR